LPSFPISTALGCEACCCVLGSWQRQTVQTMTTWLFCGGSAVDCYDVQAALVTDCGWYAKIIWGRSRARASVLPSLSSSISHSLSLTSAVLFQGMKAKRGLVQCALLGFTLLLIGGLNMWWLPLDVSCSCSRVSLC
jgi:hypothetical protein